MDSRVVLVSRALIIANVVSEASTIATQWGDQTWYLQSDAHMPNFPHHLAHPFLLLRLALCIFGTIGVVYDLRTDLAVLAVAAHHICTTVVYPPALTVPAELIETAQFLAAHLLGGLGVLLIDAVVPRPPTTAQHRRLRALRRALPILALSSLLALEKLAQEQPDPNPLLGRACGNSAWYTLILGALTAGAFALNTSPAKWAALAQLAWLDWHGLCRLYDGMTAGGLNWGLANAPAWAVVGGLALVLYDP